MDNFNRLIKNIGVLSLARVFNIILMTLVTVAIARYLGDENYGQFTFAFSFSYIFGLFFDLGLSQVIVRDVARNKNFAGKYINNIMCMKILLLIPITAFVLAIMVEVLNISYYKSLLILFASIYVLITSFSSVLRSLFRAYEKMEYDSLISVTETLAIIIAIFFTIYLELDINAVIFSYIIGSLVGLLFASFFTIKMIVKPKIEIDYSSWISIFKKSLPFGLSSLLSLIYFKTDVFMLGLYVMDAEVAWFSVAQSILTTFLFIPNILDNALFPLFSRLYLESNDTLRYAYEKTFKYLFLSGLPISIFLYFFSKEFILLFFGSEYINSEYALRVLSPVLILMFLNLYLSMILNSIDRQSVVTLLILGSAVLNLILDYVFIKEYGFIGVCYSTLMIETFLFFIMYIYLAQKNYSLNITKVVTKPLISGFFMAYYLYISNSWSIFILIPISLVIYCAILIYLGVFGSDEWELFKKLGIKENINGEEIS